VLRLRCGLFLRGGLGFRAARAVKTGVATGVIYDLFVDVGVVNRGGVHLCHGRVIAERIAGSFAAVVVVSPIAETVIDLAVELDAWVLIVFVEDVLVVVVVLVIGCP